MTSFLDDLTPQQLCVLDWVAQYVNLHDGSVPTYQQIANAIGYSKRSTAQHHMKALRRLGYVRWIPGDLSTLEFRHTDGTWQSHPYLQPQTTPPPFH